MKKKSIYLFSALIVILFVAGGSVPYEAAANGLILTSPNGGEVISGGAICKIEWAAPAEIESFQLEYSTNNGRRWNIIANGITGRSYDWRVPIQSRNKRACLVNVTGYDANGIKVDEDRSDARFTILAGMGDLEGRIQALEAAVSALQTQLADAQSIISALQTQLATAENAIGTLDTRMTSAEGNIGTLDTRLTTSEGQISTLGTRMTAAEGSVGNLDTRVTAAEVGINSLGTRLTSAESGIGNLDTRLTPVETNTSTWQELEPFVTVDNNTINGVVGPHIIFSGANVHVQSGSGSTNDGGVVTGRGNLIVGYNEAPSDLGAGERDGSHNLVIGIWHRFSSVGGFVAGSNNTISGPSATVSGGYGNEASGSQSIVTGGMNNTASGNHASVSGGSNNVASSIYSSVSGGSWNTASGMSSSVSGGYGNEASGTSSSISGGESNIAINRCASVTGGSDNQANGESSVVAGGYQRTVDNQYECVIGNFHSDD